MAYKLLRIKKMPIPMRHAPNFGIFLQKVAESSLARSSPFPIASLVVVYREGGILGVKADQTRARRIERECAAFDSSSHTFSAATINVPISGAE